jgi:hypothetical protein
MFVQAILPGKELVRDIYFHLTYSKNLGWKHALVRSPEDLKKYSIVKKNLSFLTVTKNPYSWLLSLHRRPYHQYYSKKPDFERFLQTPWKTVGRDNVTKKILNSPVELWNLKNASYIRLPNELPALNITSESILADPERIIHLISSKLSIARLSENFVDYERSTKDKTRDTNYYRDYYLNERWKENLSTEAISIINDGIDKKLMMHFGYKFLAGHN